jgi:hypothetical protein
MDNTMPLTTTLIKIVAEYDSEGVALRVDSRD